MRFGIVTTVAFATSTIAVPVSDSKSHAESQGTSKYDVIVVGSGPAGIIIADRMAEAGKKTILLEQGGPSYYITGGRERPSWLDGTKLSRVDVPGLYTSIFSTPSSMTCGDKVNAFGGCTIGGSSAINAGLFFQPPASDFDNYFPNGWKSDDMQSAIKKLNGRQPSEFITSENHKKYLSHGYINAKEWLSHAGYNETNFLKEPNDKSKVYGHTVFDYKDGQRGGPVHSYLQRALRLKNFKLQSNTKVLRVVREGGKATGVYVSQNGNNAFIHLADNGRVILSGGALQSPALLMHSGIGDPSTLGRLHSAGLLKNYEPRTWINNSAVGAGLFDNPNTYIELSSPNVKAYTYSYDNPKESDAQLYLKQRSGPYSFGSVIGAFWDTVKRNDGTTATLQGTLGTGGYTGYTDAHTITLNIYGTSGLGSKGSVVLDNNFVPGPSNDVYYSDPEDAQNIATFIRSIFDALPKSSFTSLNIDQGASQSEIVNYITTPSPYARGQVNHWSSSCRFGPCVDINTVVKGTKNIHVVDGSIIPPLSVNPQMGIMLAAERASERILAL